MHLGFIVQAADISIHALREEGDFRLCAAFSSPPISIHALREEGDPLVFAGQLHDLLFLSTPSA